MKLLGYREFAGPASRGAVFYENPNENDDEANAAEAKAVVVRLLQQTKDESELVEAIRAEFEAIK